MTGTPASESRARLGTEWWNIFHTSRTRVVTGHGHGHGPPGPRLMMYARARWGPVPGPGRAGIHATGRTGITALMETSLNDSDVTVSVCRVVKVSIAQAAAAGGAGLRLGT
jgi:hypothetical protein